MNLHDVFDFNNYRKDFFDLHNYHAVIEQELLVLLSHAILSALIKKYQSSDFLELSLLQSF